MNRVAFLAAAALVVSSSIAGVLDTSASVSASRAQPVPLAGARSAAAFANDVLAEAPLPPASSPTSSVPPLLARPMQQPGTPALIDLDRVYTTPASPTAVESDVLAHLPPGAKKTSTGSFSGRSGFGSGFVLDLVTSGPNEYLAEIVYSVISRQGGSIVRIDAQSVWEPDRRAAESIPRETTAAVTGYGESSPAQPSSEPITIALGRSASTRLVASLNALPPAPPAACHEDALLYKVVLHTPGDGTYDVAGEQCEQTVEVSLDSRQLSPLHDANCTALDLVAADLPTRAVATKQAAARCRANT